MNKIKGIIFDFDGLMVDTEIVSFHIYEEILNSFGISTSIKEYSEKYSGYSEEHNINYLISSHNLNISYDECFKMFANKEKEIIDKGVNLKNGLIELLKYLKTNNYLMAIATSSTKDRCLSILKRHNIETYFNEFVFAEDISHCKPNPEVYLKALAKLKLEANETIVLEDASSGVVAATCAGIGTICIPDMKKPEQEILNKTLKVYSNLADVIDYLEGNN